MNTEPTRESYAEAGFKALQERGPTDWVWRINEETLDIWDPSRCVLHQVFGSFAVGMSRMQLDLRGTPHGFCSSYEDNDALTAIWKRLILAERARQKAEVKEEAPALV